MPRSAHLPPDLADAFAVADAKRLGIGAARLQRSDLTKVFHGARVRHIDESLHGRAEALMPLLGEHQHFSHTTAAALLGLRLPDGHREDALHVTSEFVHRSMRRPDIVGHKTTTLAETRTLPSGIRVSAPIIAWCESAALLGIDDLIVLGDGLLARRSPIATLNELTHAVDARPGLRGTGRLRAALDEVRPATDSARETMLRLLLVRAGFPEPEVNGALTDQFGRVIAHGDLVWRRARVVGEYDGRQHALDTEQFAVDIRRLNAIADAGYRVIRVDRQLMSSPATLFRLFRNALR